MKYHIHSDAKLFAVVHADTPEEAVAIACRKTDGRDPATCTAVTADCTACLSNMNELDFFRLKEEELFGMEGRIAS